MMTELLWALGLVMVIEGLAYVLAPNLIFRNAKSAVAIFCRASTHGWCDHCSDWGTHPLGNALSFAYT